MELGVIIITLLVYLVARMLAGVSASEAAQRLAEFLVVPIVPLVLLFLILVAFRMVEILG